MEPVTTSAAPAPPTAPETISATRTAANAGSFADFDKADRAAKAGSPLPDVPAPSPTAGVVADPPPLTRKERDQQETNERIRTAVERATADLRNEVSLLREGTTRREAPPAAAPAVETPEWKRVAALPGAPKLAEFDSVEEHSAAMATFVAREILKTDQAAAQSRADADAVTTVQRQRVDKFVAQLEASKTADPTFATKLTADVRALVPFEGLKPGEAGGPRNVIAEQVYDSPIAPAVLLHLSQHPEALTALETMPATIAAIAVPALRAKAHIQHIIREYGRLEATLAGSSAPPAPAAAPPPTISAAPPPPPTLTRAGTTSDPKASAIARNDFATFDKLEMQEKRARLVRA